MKSMVLAVIVTLLSCSNIKAEGYRFGSVTESALFIPYSRIVCRPDDFDGRMLRFGAYILTGFESQVLQPDSHNLDPYNTIRYRFGEKVQMSIDEQERLSGAYVIVEGIFSSNGEGSPIVGSVEVSFVQVMIEGDK